MSKDQCSICLQELDKDVLDLQCGHQLHKQCYLALKQAHETKCPVCLKPLASKNKVPEENQLPEQRMPQAGDMNVELMSVDEIVEYKFGPHCLFILQISGLYEQMLQYYDLFRSILIENDSFLAVMMEIQQFLMIQNQ